MPKPPTALERILGRLEKHYGHPTPPATTDPVEMILCESVAYLAKDEKRAAAFEALKQRVGTQPKKILAAPEETLVEIARIGGILPELRARRLQEIAAIVHYIFKGDLKAVLRMPLAVAKKELKRFPTIGDPGAEKIMLFSGSQAVLALESNGLRVLLRLGYGEEKKNYPVSYRSAQGAAAAELPAHCASLVRAHQLLRQHGQEICKRSRPLCDICPVRAECRFFKSLKGSNSRSPAPS